MNHRCISLSPPLKGVFMLISECCGAKVIEDYDLCSKCMEHCDSYDDDEEELLGLT